MKYFHFIFQQGDYIHTQTKIHIDESPGNPKVTTNNHNSVSVLIGIKFVYRKEISNCPQN